MIGPIPTSSRELDSRAVDGIHVRLLWSERGDQVWVAVTDDKTGSEFVVEVRDRDRALDVFHHPYAYAAHYRVDTKAPLYPVPGSTSPA